MRPGLILLLLVLIAGCVSMDSSRPLVTDKQLAEETAPVLVIFLPGIRGSAEDFRRRGFFDDVDDRELPWDLVAVGLGPGHYRAGIMQQALREEVIEPALADGYREIWLVGVSLGGLGALRYAQEQPEHVAGVIVIAPFLGWPADLKAVAAGDQPEEAHIAALWNGLEKGSPGRQGPPLYLLRGEDDRLREGHRMLADKLPADHVLTSDGGHRWSVWRSLWQSWLSGSQAGGE